MTFLNASLIFALTAIAVPIVLHLIAKREPRRVVFSSVLFLTKRLESNRSKLRVRRWWLLAMRIAALAALAIALARPLINRSLSLTWLTIGLIIGLGVVLLVMATAALYRDLPRALVHSLAGAGAVALLLALLWGGYTYAAGPRPTIDEAAPVAIAIVLDNAPTSSWQTIDDDRIARIKEIATWMVTRVPPTSRIAIIDRSGAPAAFSLDLASAVSKIDQLRAIEVTSPISGKIDAAIRLVRSSDLEGRQVLVVTDLAQSTWQSGSSDPALLALLAEAPPIQLSVFDLGEFAGTNRALSVPTMADATPPRGSPVALTTTLELPQSEDDSALSITAELSLYMDDPTLPVIRDGVVQRPGLKSVDRTSVQVVPGGSSELQMTIPPLDVGSHHGLVRLIGDDALALDDVRHFTVQVLPPSHVLLVADNADEARSIDLAINAAPFPIDESNVEYMVERITYADLPVVRLADFEAILLLDPPRDVIADHALQEFVSQGGGLLVCLGAAAGDEALSSDWLPSLVRRWRSPPPHTFLEPLRLSHPVLAPLSEIPGGVPWNAYRVAQYWQIEPAKSDKVLMRYAGSTHAALLERTLAVDGAQGHVIVTTTPLPDLADPKNDWNDLFGSDAWPAFFLVRNVVERLTKRGAENWMSVVGQPQIIPLPEEQETEGAESRRLQLFPPGDTAPVPINVPIGRSQVVASDVSRSGTYWLRGVGRNIGFSVNLPSLATSTQRIEASQLNEWFGAGSYDLVTNQDEIELAELRSASQVSLRSPLMLLALAVFLLEQVLANRFYRSQAGGGHSVIGGRKSGMTSFAFEPIYGSIFVAVAVAAAIVMVLAIFTPPTANPAHRRRLIVLRSVAALALLLVVFRPSVIRTDNRPAEATLVVAVDLSRSMTLPDSEGSDRWSTQVKAWRQLAQGLQQFEETLDLQLIGYDRTARVMTPAAVDVLDDVDPAGDLTDLSEAAAYSLQAAGANPLAGVVFIGDGRHTAPLANPGDRTKLQTLGAQRSVETMNSMGVPFWSIPIGPAAGASATRDAAVDGLDESFQLFAGNEFDVAFQLRARGLAGVEVPVRLTWIDADGKRSEAADRFIVPESSDELTGMLVPLIAPPPGAYRLEIEAVKQPGELVTGNNRQTAFVEVRAGGGRILVLEGTLRPEQTFLRRSLRRFPDLDLRFKWLRKDRTWPVDLDDWLEPGKFDIYIIGDLDAAALGDDQLKKLAEAVAEGAGLVTLGGYQTYGSGGYGTSPLADVLPVRIDSSRRRGANSPRPLPRDANDPAQIPGPLPIQLRRAHPITDLGGDDPASVWRQLPALAGANRLLGPKVAPGVEVLLETTNDEPLLVVGEYGRGRVASFAIDSTYRWWRDGQSEAHRRFWRQVMLWLLSREETKGDQVVIQLDSRRFAIENPPEFRARVQTVEQPTTNPELVAEVVDADGQITAVAVSTEDLGTDRGIAIKGVIPKLKLGFYRLRVRAADASVAIQPDELAFQAVDESRELAQPMADPVYLRQLAEITADHGGAAFSADDVDELIDTIAKRRRQAETPVIEKFRLGDDPISGWILFALFAGCLSAEWFLRRRWGLA